MSELSVHSVRSAASVEACFHERGREPLSHGPRGHLCWRLELLPTAPKKENRLQGAPFKCESAPQPPREARALNAEPVLPSGDGVGMRLPLQKQVVPKRLFRFHLLDFSLKLLFGACVLIVRALSSDYFPVTVLESRGPLSSQHQPEPTRVLLRILQVKVSSFRS